MRFTGRSAATSLSDRVQTPGGADDHHEGAGGQEKDEGRGRTEAHQERVAIVALSDSVQEHKAKAAEQHHDRAECKVGPQGVEDRELAG